jgi:hypothetical protein
MATLLQKTDKDRLQAVLKRIDDYAIRFPIAELSTKLNVDKGNISAMLKGKKPISDNFFTSFNKAYPEKAAKDSGKVNISIDRDKLIIEQQKEIIRLQAKVNVVLITLADIVSKIDRKAIAIADSELTEAINREAEHLLNELQKRLNDL